MLIMMPDLKVFCNAFKPGIFFILTKIQKKYKRTFGFFGKFSMFSILYRPFWGVVLLFYNSLYRCLYDSEDS